MSPAPALSPSRWAPKFRESISPSWLLFPAMAAMEIDSPTKIPRKQATYRSLVRSSNSLPSLSGFVFPTLYSLSSERCARAPTRSWNSKLIRNLPLNILKLSGSPFVLAAFPSGSAKFCYDFCCWFFVPTGWAVRGTERDLRRPTIQSNLLRATPLDEDSHVLPRPNLETSRPWYILLSSFIYSSSACCPFCLASSLPFPSHVLVLQCVFQLHFRTSWLILPSNLRLKLWSIWTLLISVFRLLVIHFSSILL